MNTISTRRQALAALAAALAAGSLTRAQAQQPTAQQPAMEEKPSSIANQSRTSIHYEIDFHPSPERLYQAILDQKQFAAFSGLPAAIDKVPGGAFSMFGGLIVGRNVELIPSQRIVQAWRVGNWDAGVYSIARFELVEQGSGTRIVFDHTGFPKGTGEHLASGWKSNYWEPLAKFLA